MRKIKQTERPFILYYYTQDGRRLIDSARTIESAKELARLRLTKRTTDRVEIYRSGELASTCVRERK